jgi:hypothetical protein
VALSIAQIETYGAICQAGHSPIRPWYALTLQVSSDLGTALIAPLFF